MSKIVVGVDEVGWGCIAGPIVVCACAVLEENWQTLREMGFRDSKKIGNRTKPHKNEKKYQASYKDRVQYAPGKCEELAQKLEDDERNLASWCIEQMDPNEINQLTPEVARWRAMRKAIIRLMHANNWQLKDIKVVLDGNRTNPLLPKELEQVAVPKADDTVLPVSVASVLAKAYRDAQMLEWHGRYPDRGFDKHKGYPTPEHTQTVFNDGLIEGLYRIIATKNLLQRYFREMTPRDRKRIGHPVWLRPFGWIEEVEEEERAKEERAAKRAAKPTGASTRRSAGRKVAGSA